MADKSIANIPKLDLRIAPLYRYQVRGGKVKHYSLFDLIIDNYFNLKYNSEYSKHFIAVDWTLMVQKKRRFLTVGIIAETFRGMEECYVDYGRNVYSCPVHVQKKCETLIEVDIPSSIVEDSRNIALNSGTLCIVFKGQLLGEFQEIPRPFTGIKNNRENDVTFCRSLARRRESSKSEGEVISTSFRLNQYMSVSDEHNFWDFSISIPNSRTFFVHKAILAARSGFFYDFLKENREKRGMVLLDAQHDAVFFVLCFLYGGKLKAKPKEMMSQFADLADRLKIKSLKNLCKNYKECKYSLDQLKINSLKNLC